MNDYINRQTMLDAVEKLNIISSIDGTGKPTPSEDFRVQFLGTVLKVPAADVVPYSIEPDGTLTVTVPKGTKVGRVFVQEDGTHWGGLFYAE